MGVGVGGGWLKSGRNLVLSIPYFQGQNCKRFVIKDLQVLNGHFFKNNIHSFIYNAHKMRTVYFYKYTIT